MLNLTKNLLTAVAFLVYLLIVIVSSAHAQSTNEQLRAKFEKSRPQTMDRRPSSVVRRSSSFWRPLGPGTVATSALCFGGAAVDLATTLGKGEANPLFRNSRGGLNVPLAAGVGFGFCGSTILFEKLVPQSAKWMHAIRSVSGGVHLASAVRNSKIKRAHAVKSADCIVHTIRTMIFFCVYDITYVVCCNSSGYCATDQSSVLVECGFPEIE